MCNLGSLDFCTVNSKKFSEGRHILGQGNTGDDMCQLDKKNNLVVGEAKFSSVMIQIEDYKVCCCFHFFLDHRLRPEHLNVSVSSL